MIVKHEDYENGYYFVTGESNNSYKQSVADFEEIKKKYDEIKCIICNKATSNNFIITRNTIGVLNTFEKPQYYRNITINNKLNDGCFFVNRIK